MRFQLIQFPLIHLLLAGISAWMVARALYSGEAGLNASRYTRSEAPIRYWFAIALGCFLIYAFGSPAID